MWCLLLALAHGGSFTGVQLGGTWTVSKHRGETRGVRVALVYGFGEGNGVSTVTFATRFLTKNDKVQTVFAEAGVGVAHAPLMVPVAADLVVGAAFVGDRPRLVLGATAWTAFVPVVSPRFDIDVRLVFVDRTRPDLVGGVGAQVSVIVPHDW